MSVSHCMLTALRIAKRPSSQWQAELKRLPDACEHADCGVPKSCRKRISEYLQMQERMAQNRGKK